MKKTYFILADHRNEIEKIIGKITFKDEIIAQKFADGYIELTPACIAKSIHDKKELVAVDATVRHQSFWKVKKDDKACCHPSACCCAR